MAKVTVPFSARDAKTADLIKGLYNGFNLTFYDMDAVNELLTRGERAAVEQARAETTSRWGKWACTRGLKAFKSA